MKSTPLEDTPQAAPGHYTSRAYNTKERACSFWHQVDEIFEIGASTVLEIGSGSGLVTNWLRTAGVEVKTLDLEPELEPDIVGSVTDIPLSANSCDAVLCCQVLEHLPFDQLPVALTEIGRVSRMGAVISLPDVTPWVGIAYPLYFGLYADQVRERLPGGAGRGLLALLRRQIRLRDYLFAHLVPVDWAYGGKVWEMRRPPIPSGPLSTHDFKQGQLHCYEIGMEGYPLERVLGAFAAAQLEVIHEFRVPENPWHHFFNVRSKS